MKRFVDISTVIVRAGHGGPGSVSFRREKYIPKGGPDGGNGGKGGDVIFEASHSVMTLLDLKIKRQYSAKNGKPGLPKNKSGAKGENVILKVPFGTLIYDHDGTLLSDLHSDNPSFVAAKGGIGGKGNKSFATPVNRTPERAQSGLPGEEKELTLELKLIAQVGLLGLPNAGKSTLLKQLTRANPKIAAYPFTTLVPNLGVLKALDKEVVIADIPGIIEGASKGEGLGLDFIRHVDRTQVLIHLVSLEDGSAEKCFDHWKTIKEELKKSKVSLNEKIGLTLLTKTDTISDEEVETILAEFKRKKIDAIAISSFNPEDIDKLSKTILPLVRNK